ncbi:MAG: choice-of-anchor J domain-containing protein [Flavobacteriales bacterium]|jgi:PKD repeat protein|nr:choice-of-anchor J domain-containing protein [Flavobacteriales bacterium]MBP8878082.1 choice-of-anchor J domain-containing protein [Flavobacteriales bacterium]
MCAPVLTPGTLRILLLHPLPSMRSISLFGIAVFATALHAQDDANFSCLTHDPGLLSRITNDDPEMLQRMEMARTELELRTDGFERDRGQGFVIPVVFHIVHAFGQENISNEQVEDAIRILNDDYNKENPDWVNVRPAFLDLVADVGITFRLAQRDPQGNCSNGITRTVSTLTHEGDYAMTQLIQWPRDRYMNIWVGAQANGAAGYTNYPWVLDNSPQSDGIVVRAGYVGSIGTSSPGRSRVLSHEVGHWLNLQHCWGNSNDPGSEDNCSMDDGVQDTPLTKGWTSCALSGASCGSALDNVENYMEYSYCDKMFTLGQADRMIAALTSSVADRSDLWQPTNLSATGVTDDPLLCHAEFSMDRHQICAGESISFTDLSYNHVVTRSWEFPGGAPTTSTDYHPDVVYDEPGTYPVTLTVGDGTSTLSSTQIVAVEVLPYPGMTIPFAEGFEAIDDLNGSDWTTFDPYSDGTYNVTSLASVTGSQSVRLPNTGSMSGRTDALISPVFDLSDAEEITLTYRYAFAKRNNDNVDGLGVYVSNDCGTTWSLRRQLWAISTLSTGGVVVGNFVPTEEQWAENTITSISGNYAVEGFRFKFQFTHGGGNDLYLDDINLNGLTVGMDDRSNSEGIRLWPNPAQDRATLEMDLVANGQVSIRILDVLGRPVAPSAQLRMGRGLHRIDLPLTNLADGTYFLHVYGDPVDQMVKLIVGQHP